MTREQAKGNLIHAIRWNDMPKKEALDVAIKALEQEPKTGHWIESRCNMWVCSACGYTHTDLSGEKDGMNYCPNCGIQMMKAKTMKNAAAQDAGKYADAPTLMPGA